MRSTGSSPTKMTTEVADREPSARVLIVGLNYVPEPTGIAPYTTGLAEGLTRGGVPVRVIAGFPHYPQWRVQDGYAGRTMRETIGGVPVTRVRHFVPSAPRLVDRLLLELGFGLRAVTARWGRPDVLLLVSPALFSTGMAGLRARLAGVPHCVWVQDIYTLGVAESGTGGRVAGRLLSRVERSILRSADRVVVIHDRFKRYLVQELGVDPERIDVVRNWSHVDEAPSFSRTGTRERLGWGRDDVVVLHAGNMGAKQGLENVVHASQLAAERGSRVRFVLLGDGNRRSALEALGGNSALDFVDPLPDEEFTAALHAADVLLVNERPGLTEMSVPSKLTSYFSTGLPVIAATDAASVTAEELARSGAGVRVDAADPAALLAAAEALAADPEAAAAYGRAGRAFRGAHLSEDAAIAAFRSILDDVTRSTPPVRATTPR
jgi:colanic acid biosynthesis glycosyl transferase WcaI